MKLGKLYTQIPGIASLCWFSADLIITAIQKLAPEKMWEHHKN